MLQKLTRARRHARETPQKPRNMRGKMLGAAASRRRRNVRKRGSGGEWHGIHARSVARVSRDRPWGESPRASPLLVPTAYFSNSQECPGCGEANQSAI